MISQCGWRVSVTNQVSELLEELQNVQKFLLHQRQTNPLRLQHLKLGLEQLGLLCFLLELLHKRLSHLEKHHSPSSSHSEAKLPWRRRPPTSQHSHYFIHIYVTKYVEIQRCPQNLFSWLGGASGGGSRGTEMMHLVHLVPFLGLFSGLEVKFRGKNRSVCNISFKSQRIVKLSPRALQWFNTTLSIYFPRRSNEWSFKAVPAPFELDY